MFKQEFNQVPHEPHATSKLDSEPEHLPIFHPGYRYPPSKNLYWTKLQAMPQTVYLDNDSETQRGSWNSHFHRKFNTPLSTELHIEIGCNAGHVLLEWAKREPHKIFMGIDWKYKPIFRCAEKAAHRSLSNLFLLRAHAERIQYIYGPQEIDSLSLYFPDPWPRKSQWKNRFFTETRLREIARVMKPNGVFHVKTDHPGYFDWMIEAVSKVGELWEIVEFSKDLHKNHPSPEQLKIPEVTLFETLFIKDRIPIQSLKLKRLNK